MREILLRRLCAAAAIAATLLAPVAAMGAMTPDGVFPTQPQYSDADLQLLYDEAAGIGSHTYVFYLYTTESEILAQDTYAQLQLPQLKGQDLGSILKLEAQRVRAFALPATVREQLWQLRAGQRSGLFQPDKKRWAIVELAGIDSSSAMPRFEQLRSALPKLVADGALPPPQRLRDEPALVERGLMNKVSTTAEFDRLPPGFFIDRPLSNGYVMLQRMLSRDDPAMVTAVLQRGADTNLCPMQACPLQLALASKANAANYVDALLKAGAKPDQLPDNGPPDTALAMASNNGQLDVAARLLAGGADPDGRKSANSPLMVALYNGNQAMAQLLLDHGADPLLHRPLAGPALFYTPIAAAQQAKRADTVAWFRSVLLKKLAAKPAYRWAAWVEQDGIRHPLGKAPIHLQRRPFSLYVRMAPEATLRLEAATGTPLFEELKGDLDAPLFDLRRQQSELPQDLDSLLVSEGLARGAHATPIGGLLAWSPARGSFTATASTRAGTLYVRTVNRLRLDDGLHGVVEVPLEDSTQRELDLVIGTAVDYSALSGELVNARKLRLLFPPVKAQRASRKH